MSKTDELGRLLYLLRRKCSSGHHVWVNLAIIPKNPESGNPEIVIDVGNDPKKTWEEMLIKRVMGVVERERMFFSTIEIKYIILTDQPYDLISSNSLLLFCFRKRFQRASIFSDLDVWLWERKIEILYGRGD